MVSWYDIICLPTSLLLRVYFKKFHAGCHGINGGRGSLTVNLVSRCVLRDWQEVYGKLTPPIEDTHLQLSQVDQIPLIIELVLYYNSC